MLRDPLSLSFPPNMVTELFHQYETERSASEGEIRHYISAYVSEFWSDRSSGKPTGRFDSISFDGNVWVESNRVKPFIESLVGRLYPDSLDVSVLDSPDEQGNAQLSAWAIKQWIANRDLASRCKQAIRMALLEGKAGIKMGRDTSMSLPPGVPVNPFNAVWMRVIPAEEILLDTTVCDVDDQRYVGHVYWIPKSEAERRFHWLEIQGSSRSTAKSGKTPVVTGEEYVQVMEFYNLVDDYYFGEADLATGAPNSAFVLFNEDGTPVEDPDVQGGGTKPFSMNGTILRTRGRFEVYLPNQQFSQKAGMYPVQVFPMLNTDAYQRPLAPIVPCILFHNPLHPLEGMSVVKPIYDQQLEINIARSALSTATRSMGRAWLRQPGLMDTQQDASLKAGTDGVIIDVKSPDGSPVNLDNVMRPIPHASVSPDVYRHVNIVEEDISRQQAVPRFTMGEATGASATEVLQLNAHAQDEMGQLLDGRDKFMSRVAALYLRVQYAALRAIGPDARLSVRIPDGERDISDPLKEPAKFVRVTAEDLDGNFSIEVMQGSTNPQEVAQRRQRIATMLPVVVPLINAVAAGGEPAAGAAIILDELITTMELPRSWLSKNVRRKVKAAIPVPPTQPGTASAMPGGGSVSPPEITPGGPQPEAPQPTPDQGGAAPNDGAAGVLNP